MFSRTQLYFLLLRAFTGVWLYFHPLKCLVTLAGMILISLCILARTSSETTFETNGINVMEKLCTEPLLFFSY